MSAVLLDQHPALACAGAAKAALRDGTEVPVEYLGAGDQAALLVELAEIDSLTAAMRLRVMPHASELAADYGARDVASWVSHHTRTDLGLAQRDLRLAQALGSRWTQVAAALGDGRVNLGQARVIVEALDALPSGIEPEVVARAEVHLIELAGRFTPKQLRVLGRRVLDVVAPEVGEAHEARALAEEERRARESTVLSFRPAGDGRTRIEALVPDLVAHRLRTYLEAFTSPRRAAFNGGGGSGERLPADQQRGQAFCSLLEAVDPKRLPMHGGDATTVFVTVTLDALRANLATAGLITAEDDRISASEARRLACTANLVPVVLGSRSEILDLGRTARLHSKAQRKAMRLRDRRCRAKGCTVAAPWCEAHHLDPWGSGGETSVEDGVLLCSFHHHCAHEARYLTELLADGDISFHRRT